MIVKSSFSNKIKSSNKCAYKCKFILICYDISSFSIFSDYFVNIYFDDNKIFRSSFTHSYEEESLVDNVLTCWVMIDYIFNAIFEQIYKKFIKRLYQYDL